MGLPFRKLRVSLSPVLRVSPCLRVEFLSEFCAFALSPIRDLKQSVVRCGYSTSEEPRVAVKQDVTVERLQAELRAAQEQVAHLRAEVDERNAEVQLLHEIATALAA